MVAVLDDKYFKKGNTAHNKGFFAMLASARPNVLFGTGGNISSSIYR